MTVTTYKGLGCEAVLDTDAGTVTLTHSGMTVQKHKKKSSPWVIPLGAITDVEFKEKSALARGWVRLVLTDRVGWAKDQIEDVNAFFAGKDKVTPFVDAVNVAREGAAPAELPAAPAQSTLSRLQETTDAIEARKDALQGKRDALRAETAARKSGLGPAGEERFNGIAVRDGERIEFNGQTFPLAGARASVEVGAPKRRTTATRMVVGSAVTLGVGTMIGAMAKKTTGGSVYVTVELADGQVILVEADPKQESRARKFAAALTSSAARATSRGITSSSDTAVIDAEVVEDTPALPASAPPPPPPPPPGVPADWYPDPDDSALLRYWDGGSWTQHTAPRPPQ